MNWRLPNYPKHPSRAIGLNYTRPAPEAARAGVPEPHHPAARDPPGHLRVVDNALTTLILTNEG